MPSLRMEDAITHSALNLRLKAEYLECFTDAKQAADAVSWYGWTVLKQKDRSMYLGASIHGRL